MLPSREKRGRVGGRRKEMPPASRVDPGGETFTFLKKQQSSQFFTPMPMFGLKSHKTPKKSPLHGMAGAVLGIGFPSTNNQLKIPGRGPLRRCTSFHFTSQIYKKENQEISSNYSKDFTRSSRETELATTAYPDSQGAKNIQSFPRF